jgi:hypothetical protein
MIVDAVLTLGDELDIDMVRLCERGSLCLHSRHPLWPFVMFRLVSRRSLVAA